MKHVQLSVHNMYVRVHVIPGARKETVTKRKDGVLYIAVREKAERNMANTRIREILAREYNVALTQVTLLTGHRSSSKMYSIEHVHT